MRRYFKIILSLILLLSGCQTKNSINLEELTNELVNVSEEGFDIYHVLSSVEYEKENIFDNLIDVYDYDYETLGISVENITHGIVRISPTTAQMYMVFIPANGKEQKLITELQNILVSKKSTATTSDDIKLLENALIEENDDFIALIVSSNNQEILERIKNSRTHLFGVLTPATDEDLATYGLTKEWITEYLIQKPLLTTSKTYMIIKPRVGFEEKVKTAIDTYLIQLKNQFLSMPSEAKAISNALVTEIDGYQVVIISSDNEKVLEVIQTYFEK